MMISPGTYVMLHKDMSYKELIEERDGLIEEIHKLEKQVLNRNPLDEEWQICPDPETRYSVSLQYLVALCQMMCEKKWSLPHICHGHHV